MPSRLRRRTPHAFLLSAALTAALGVAVIGCDDAPADGTADTAADTASSPGSSTDEARSRSSRVRPSGTASLSGAQGNAPALRLKSGRVQNVPNMTDKATNSIHLDYIADSEEGDGPKRLSLWIQLPKAGLSEGQEIDVSQIEPDVHTYDALNYDATSGPRYDFEPTGTMIITSLVDNRLGGKAIFTVKHDESGTDDDPAIQVTLDFEDIELPDGE